MICVLCILARPRTYTGSDDPRFIMEDVVAAKPAEAVCCGQSMCMTHLLTHLVKTHAVRA